MGERLRSLFLLFLSLLILWLVVVLFWLVRGDNPYLQPRFSSYYRAPSQLANGFNGIDVSAPHEKRNENRIHDHGLTTSEVLFYQFDSKRNDSIHERKNSTNKELHIDFTQKLNHVDGSLDELVIFEGSRLFAFNLLVSNRIGLIRELPDTRNHLCNSNLSSNTSIVGENQLNGKHKASVIICYYNESPSALFRSIYTVLERSPKDLLKEIIVIDDFSDDEYSSSRFKPMLSSDLVVFKRTTKREGLIRARLYGANIAKGEILVFLDSHVEANNGWLEPLISTVVNNKSTIACPMIDLINAESMIYSASPMVKGGLDWALHFKWDSVSSRNLKTKEDFIKPIESPTMAGGLYAIDREFFFYLGGYDPEMELWGGENIEISLRTWMCGGSIVILPCSRVGHIFRKRRPYGTEPDKPDSLLYNSHRVARVWLDKFIDKFYEANPDARFLNSGDISTRIELKQSLKCRNFTWFLDHVYPDLNNSKQELANRHSNHNLFRFNDSMKVRSQKSLHNHNNIKTTQSYEIHRPERETIKSLQKNQANRQSKQSYTHSLSRNPNPKVISRFQIQAENSNFCIESRASVFAKNFKRLILNYCIEGSPSEKSYINQLWTKTELNDFRIGEDQCLDIEKNLPLLRQCHNLGSFQSWIHHETNTSNTTICNSGGSLCIGVERLQVEEPIIVTICDTPALESKNHFNGIEATPGWRTGSALARMRFRNINNVESVRPIQRWNLLIYKY